MRRRPMRTAAVSVAVIAMLIAVSANRTDRAAANTDANEITRDSDALRRYGGPWYKGERGNSGPDGFWYTYDPDAYADWHFGDLEGEFRAEVHYPSSAAVEAGTCGSDDRGCRRRPPTASPHYYVWQRDSNGEWDIIYDWKTSILDSDGERKEGWWGWNNVRLNGYIVARIFKRYDDTTYRLAADSFRFIRRQSPRETAEDAVPSLSDYQRSIDRGNLCDRPGTEHPHPLYPAWNLENKNEYYSFHTGECTSWVRFRLNSNGIPFHNGYPNTNPPNLSSTIYHWGNAHKWDDTATRAGLIVNKSPKRGAVAQWEANEGGAGSAGHVAYVEEVLDGGKTIVISEMNGPGNWKDGRRLEWCLRDIRTLHKGLHEWEPDFIHF